MYADASGAAQTFQYDTAALQQLGASVAPLGPQPGGVGASLTWTQGSKLSLPFVSGQGTPLAALVKPVWVRR